MKHPIHSLFSTKRLMPVVALLALAVAGCTKNAPPPPVTLQEVPATMQKAFAEAPPEAKKSAEAASAAIQEQDNVKSFVSLQELAARPDLNPDQRMAAAQAQMAVNARLREAAAKGDKRAEDLLNTYRARK